MKTRPRCFRDPVVFVIYIPRSWVSPHMVTFGGASKFYARNSAGKYQLDVFELRSAFTASSLESEKIKQFHAHRIGRILSDETPVQLANGAKIILHIIPVGAIVGGTHYDLKVFQLSQNRHFLSPIDSDYGSNFRFNFDGVMTYQGDIRNASADSYIQLFRNGIIESVTTTLFSPEDKPPTIPSILFEKGLVQAVTRYFHIFDLLEVEEPIFILLSLLGVAGYNLPTRSRGFGRHNNLIDRNDLFVPELLVDDRMLPIHKILKPAFDTIWNAAGQPQSPFYNAEGHWDTK